MQASPSSGASAPRSSSFVSRSAQSPSAAGAAVRNVPERVAAPAASLQVATAAPPTGPGIDGSTVHAAPVAPHLALASANTRDAPTPPARGAVTGQSGAGAGITTAAASRRASSAHLDALPVAGQAPTPTSARSSAAAAAPFPQPVRSLSHATVSKEVIAAVGPERMPSLAADQLADRGRGDIAAASPTLPARIPPRALSSASESRPLSGAGSLEQPAEIATQHAPRLEYAVPASATEVGHAAAPAPTAAEASVLQADSASQSNAAASPGAAAPSGSGRFVGASVQTPAVTADSQNAGADTQEWQGWGAAPTADEDVAGVPVVDFVAPVAAQVSAVDEAEDGSDFFSELAQPAVSHPAAAQPASAAAPSAPLAATQPYAAPQVDMHAGSAAAQPPRAAPVYLPGWSSSDDEDDGWGAPPPSARAHSGTHPVSGLPASSDSVHAGGTHLAGPLPSAGPLQHGANGLGASGAWRAQPAGPGAQSGSSRPVSTGGTQGTTTAAPQLVSGSRFGDGPSWGATTAGLAQAGAPVLPWTSAGTSPASSPGSQAPSARAAQPAAPAQAWAPPQQRFAASSATPAQRAAPAQSWQPPQFGVAAGGLPASLQPHSWSGAAAHGAPPTRSSSIGTAAHGYTPRAPPTTLGQIRTNSEQQQAAAPDAYAPPPALHQTQLSATRAIGQYGLGGAPAPTSTAAHGARAATAAADVGDFFSAGDSAADATAAAPETDDFFGFEADTGQVHQSGPGGQAAQAGQTQAAAAAGADAPMDRSWRHHGQMPNADQAAVATDGQWVSTAATTAAASHETPHSSAQHAAHISTAEPAAGPDDAAPLDEKDAAAAAEAAAYERGEPWVNEQWGCWVSACEQYYHDGVRWRHVSEYDAIAAAEVVAAAGEGAADAGAAVAGDNAGARGGASDGARQGGSSAEFEGAGHAFFEQMHAHEGHAPESADRAQAGVPMHANGQASQAAPSHERPFSGSGSWQPDSALPSAQQPSARAVPWQMPGAPQASDPAAAAAGQAGAGQYSQPARQAWQPPAAVTAQVAASQPALRQASAYKDASQPHPGAWPQGQQPANVTAGPASAAAPRSVQDACSSSAGRPPLRRVAFGVGGRVALIDVPAPSYASPSPRVAICQIASLNAAIAPNAPEASPLNAGRLRDWPGPLSERGANVKALAAYVESRATEAQNGGRISLAVLWRLLGVMAKHKGCLVGGAMSGKGVGATAAVLDVLTSAYGSAQGVSTLRPDFGMTGDDARATAATVHAVEAELLKGEKENALQIAVDAQVRALTLLLSAVMAASLELYMCRCTATWHRLSNVFRD